MRDIGPLVGAIDQGTTSTRFIVFSAVDGSMITYHQVPVQRSYPNDGWAEQRPQELFDSVLETTSVVLQKLADMQIDHRAIQCIGLANQRESAVVWDRVTGEPLYNCILWFDNRTAEIVDSVLDHIPGRDLNWLKEKTGLPLSTYFTAFKLKWLLKNVPAVKAALDAGTLLFGTVDSWLLWRLTGGQVHATDVTNASRTLLMDIETLQWDGELCRFFNIPPSILPTIHPSAHHYGEVSVGALAGLPLTAVIGDQNAALVGQQCFSIGQAKVTYGTGCFLIQNIGPGPLHGALKAVPAEAKKQLIITVAYQFGGRPACYAVEGSVATAGALITWLCKELKLVEDYKSIEPIALQENNSGGVFFVPALQGLFAPYWDLNATGTIIGLSSSTTRSHVVRAALEGVAYQANDVLSMMQPSGGTVGIRVDGGMACNDLLCQFLADISGSRIIRPQTTEATALGAAIVAGYTKRLWPELESHIEDYMGAAGGQSKGEVDLHELFYGQAEGAAAAAAVDSNGNFLNGAAVSANGAASSGLLGQLARGLTLTNGTASESGKRPSLQARIFEQSQDVFEPSLDEDLRLNRISTWRKAVERSLKWVKVEKQEQRKENYKRLSTLPFMIYVLVSFGTTILSQMVVSR